MAEETLNNQTTNDASLDEEIAAAEAELKAAEERLNTLRKQASEEPSKAEAEETQSTPAEQPAPSEANIPGFTPYNPVSNAEQTTDYRATQTANQNQNNYYANPGYAQGQNDYYNYNGYANQQQPGYNAYQNYYVPPTQTTSSKDHVAAGLLAIFLGSLGIHKFYLGYNTPGFIMLAVSILGSLFTFGLAGAVMGIIAIVEGIIYLTRSQSEFEAIYVTSKREWF